MLLQANALGHIAWIRTQAKDLGAATAALNRAFALAARIGVPEVAHKLRITARELAVLREDATAVLELEQQLEAFHSSSEYGHSPADSVIAKSVLIILRDEQAAQRRARAARQERINALSAAREEMLRTYRWALAIAAFLLTAGFAVTLYRGKQRAERMHVRLQEEIERTRASEAARERLQQTIYQLERLEALSVFAAGFAHDFNNLLCSISGHAELTREHVPTSEQEGLDTILESAQKGQERCQRLFDYAQPAAERSETNDIGRLLIEAKLLFESAPEREGELEFAPVAEVLPVRIERAAFEQALVSVVINARDQEVGATRVRLAARQSGRVPEVTGDGTWFGRLQEAPSYAVVDVRDDGCGIAPVRIKRVFDPFYTTKFAGRGLGLSAALGIVTAHGGAFHVTSSLNSGSCFSVWLPLAEPNGPPSAAISDLERVTATDPLKILAVDDEPAILAYLSRTLRNAGHEVRTAQTQACALDLLGERGAGFDVILLDLSMPDVDGTELFDLAVEQLPGVPLVVMSGHSRQFIEDRTRNYPITEVLQKPFRADGLRQAVARAAQAIERTG